MKAKILVVDDEPDLEPLIRQKFRRKIRNDEFEFIFALNGVDALQKISENPDVEIILSDINMPQMDGLTLLGKVTEQYPAIKMVMVTAYGDMENIRMAMNRGAFDFLTKPIDFSDLEITINKTLQSARQLKEAEEQEKLAIKAREELVIHLQETDRLKDEFLANTSHELRTPLNGIIGIAESIIDGAAGNISQELKKNLLMVVLSGKRLSSLVNDIMDFSKLKHRHIDLSLKPVGIREVTDIVLTILKPLAEKKSLSLVNSIPADMPLVTADENRIQQIMHNLVGNAIKFTGEGAIDVSAVISGESAEISIKDTGIGIPDDKVGKIFEAFEQADGSIEREYGGTGIGLTITKQLVELHGGNIRVNSRVGEGTTFTFSLPLSSESTGGYEPDISRVRYFETAEEKVDSLIEIIENRNGNNGHKRILVVDDEVINQQVFSNYLSLENYSIMQAFNGPEALAILQESKEKIDLVLLDIMMPKMSGYEVCMKIREKFLPSELPIVLLTAKNQVSDLVAGFESGANDYITKPVSKNELLSRIKTHIRLSQINHAYGRFVPHEFLRFLGRESIVDVKLGDQIQKEMTVLFSDIRAFTTISETLTPKENFDFLNDYLSRISPVIRNNNGFIDKYIGDAVMALFPENAEDAVNASVKIAKELEKYNLFRLENGMVPISIGIGLHTGSLMLGTIGEELRMEGTVISDAVNLASRLEGLTKIYGVTLVVSEQVINSLSAPEKYHYRTLGKVKVKGKKATISVFEIYDGDSAENIELRERTKEIFEHGIKLFLLKEFNEAKGIFNRVLEINPGDTAAQYYIKKCENFALAPAIE